MIQGNEDRIVARRYFELLQAALPRAEGVILPTVGHQPHLTHAEAMAGLIGDWLLPCAPEGCSEQIASGAIPARWIASRSSSTMPESTASMNLGLSDRG